MVSPSGTAIAFNGELYNADELRTELNTAGRRFAGGSDTEVALAAFDEWGDEAFARLDGMFALAVYDRARDRMLLARDPIGIKPLYYAEEAGGLLFASELRALLSVRRTSPEVSVEGLAGYLALGAPQEPGTIVDGVHMLAPGTLLTFTGAGMHARRWWSLEQTFAGSRPIARADAVEQLRGALESAIRRQLVSDVPLGVFLSGGVDSSGLVGLATRAGVTPRTVSVVFAEQEFTEARWIEAVVAHHETEHQQVELRADDFRDALPNALAAMDQPTMDGVNTYVISRVAREAGLKVALSGLGGDELFAGYELFRSAPRLDSIRRHVPRLPHPLAARAGRVAAGRGDRGRKLGRWLGGEDCSAYALQRELLDPQSRAALLSTPAYPATDAPPPRIDAINALSLQELTTFARNVLLRDADVMSMAHGLELRVPLLDLRVVELVAAMPGKLKLDRRREKGLLVDALGDLLTPAVARRPKMGFTLPFEAWMRGPLRTQIQHALNDASFGGAIARRLDPSAVTGVWRQFEAGRTSWSRPWALYTAKVWSQANLP